MDRIFFVRSQLHRGTFCSSCGARVLSDEKVMRRHGARRHLDGNLDNFIPVREKLDYGYRLRAADGNLVLEICRAAMVNVPGKIGEFVGAEWSPELRIFFPGKGNEIRVEMNETQLEPEAWLASIRAGKVCRISRESDWEVIRQVFPTIPAVYSLQMFAHLYKTSGFRQREALSGQEERALLESRPLTGKKRQAYLQERMQEMEDYLAGLDPDDVDEGQAISEESNLFPISADLHYIGEEPILRIVLWQKNKKDIVLLFGEGYRAWSSLYTPEMAVRLLKGQCFMDEKSQEAIMEYSRIYPQIKLGGCLKAVMNPFLALYGWDYHYGLGLTLQEGFFQMAASWSQYAGFRKDPSLYDNVADMIGIPKKWMKKRR